MKKSPNLYLICFFLAFYGTKCISQEKKATNGHNIFSSFAGQWVLKPHFDRLKSQLNTLESKTAKLNDLLKMDEEIPIQISIPASTKDMLIIYWNDWESTEHEFDVTGKRSLKFRSSNELFHIVLKETDELTINYFKAGKLYKKANYFKASDKTFSKPNAYKSLIYSTLFSGDYSAYNDKNTSIASKVFLTEKGKVVGLPPYKSFFLQLDSDLMAEKDKQIISLNKENPGSDEEFYAALFYPEWIELYTLKTNTLPDEKPYYERDALFLRLKKNPIRKITSDPTQNSYRRIDRSEKTTHGK